MSTLACITWLFFLAIPPIIDSDPIRNTALKTLADVLIWVVCLEPPSPSPAPAAENARDRYKEALGDPGDIGDPMDDPGDIGDPGDDVVA